jgi:hypothetical protein
VHDATTRMLRALEPDTVRRIALTHSHHRSEPVWWAPTRFLSGELKQWGSSTKTCRTTPRAVQPGRYLAVGAPSSPDAWSLPARVFWRCAAS